jgi:hypothetical protein
MKIYCEYCNVYIKGSRKTRIQHRRGNRHKTNYNEFYEQLVMNEHKKEVQRRSLEGKQMGISMNVNMMYQAPPLLTYPIVNQPHIPPQRGMPPVRPNFALPLRRANKTLPVRPSAKMPKNKNIQF